MIQHVLYACGGIIAGAALYGFLGGTIKQHVTTEIAKVREDFSDFLAEIKKKL